MFHMRQIEEMLPESHFIHLIRGGRDVALFWRKTWFSPGPDVKTLASHWKQSVMAGLGGRTGTAHYLDVRYDQNSPAERDAFASVAGDLPVQLGYEP